MVRSVDGLRSDRVVYVRGSHNWTEHIRGGTEAIYVVGLELRARFAIRQLPYSYPHGRSPGYAVVAMHPHAHEVFRHHDFDAAFMWATMQGDDK